MTAESAPPDSLFQGLDLIIFVDVSTSMSRDGAKAGSDPDRIRWDAVKLVVDLLTADDRVLIQRFNHECPPAYFDEKGNPLVYLGHQGDRPLFPLKPENDFPRRLVSLDSERDALCKCIAQFSTTDDYLGTADQGDTDMIGALQRAEEWVSLPATARRVQALLLTDGVDNSRNRYHNDASMREALSYFTGDRPGHSRIPIHTIGLGLNSEGAGASDVRISEAERYLARISKLTGGHFYRANSSHDLITAFFNLVRDMKGVWWRHQSFAPSQQAESLPPMSINGVVDVGLLMHENLPDAHTARSTAPLAKPLEYQWVNLGDEQGPVPIHRTGKNDSLYDFYCFATGRGDEMPFADWSSPVRESARLLVTLPASSRVREVTEICRTQYPLFAIVKPEEGTQFFSHQTPEVRVVMDDSTIFRPEQFDVVAWIVAPGGLLTEDGRQPLQEVPLAPQPNSRVFSGRLMLSRLPRTEETVNYYSLLVMVRGKADVAHGLSGYQTNLLPRTIAVENRLILQPVPSIELTGEHRNATVTISANTPVDENLVLQAEFIPFERDGKPVDLEGFVVSAEAGAVSEHGIPLTRGAGQITIGFPDAARLPKGGVLYRPGKIVITGSPDVRMDPLEIEVRLRIDLVRVGIEPGQFRLEAQPMPVAGPEATVVLAPPDQPKTKIGELTVAIQQSPAGNDVPEKAFSSRELWVQPKGDDVSPPDERSQTLVTRLNKPFQVYFEPAGDRDAKRYDCRVVVSGTGVDSAEAPLSLLIRPPTLELRDGEITIHAKPGSAGSGTAYLQLRGIGGPPEHVHLVRPGAGRTVAFVKSDSETGRGSVDVELRSYDQDAPLEVPWPGSPGTTDWVALPIDVRVPRASPCGRYSCQLAVAGERVADQPLTVWLVINELLADVKAGREENAEEQDAWEPANEVRIVQFLRHDMRKTLRIRTAMGQALEPEHLQIDRIRPFADELGDVMPLPRIESVKAGEEQETLLVTLCFPATPMAHIELPYRILLQLSYPSLSVEPVKLPFYVRFWNHEQFFASREQAK